MSHCCQYSTKWSFLENIQGSAVTLRAPKVQLAKEKQMSVAYMFSITFRRPTEIMVSVYTNLTLVTVILH